MSDLLHIVKGLSAQPKCVLVLGARTEAMLNWLFSLTATQVILVEPEPAMFEKATVLYNAKDSLENVVIKHGIPAFEAEQKSTRYFVSNVPGFSSVLPPNAIESIRPALEFTEQEVPLIDLKPLLQQFDISEGRSCLLISQLNGGEQQCLNNQIVNAFTHVVIQSSLKPTFGESKPVENLKKELAECGRDYLVLAESMPPFSNFVTTKKINADQALNYFGQRLQHKEIKSSLEGHLSASQNKTEKVTEELKQAMQQLQAASQQNEEERKQLTEELQQTKHQLQITKQQAEEKQKQLAEELKQAMQQLQAASQQNEEERKQLTEELQQTKHQLQITKQQAEEKQKQLAEELKQAMQQLQAASQQNEEERKQLTEELQKTKHHLQITKQQAEEKQKQLAEESKQAKQQLQAASQQNEEERRLLAEELQQTKHQLQTTKQQAEEKQKQLVEELQNTKQILQSINVQLAEGNDNIKGLNLELTDAKKFSEMHLKASETANRLNLSLQADLTNLRAQYMEKVDEAESLTNLVNDLYVKLKQAANYYHSLEGGSSTSELTGNTRG